MHKQLLPVNTQVNDEALDAAVTIQPLFELLNAPEVHTTAFQSVLVTAIQILQNVRHRETMSWRASISLAQGENLSAMVDETNAMLELLKQALNQQGQRVLSIVSVPPITDKSPISWWFSIAESIETLNSGIDWIGSIVSGQPKDSPARRLSGAVTQLLQLHYNIFLGEAEEWLN